MKTIEIDIRGKANKLKSALKNEPPNYRGMTVQEIAKAENICMLVTPSGSILALRSDAIDRITNEMIARA